jgi:SAM-dependent methyltransferase
MRCLDFDAAMKVSAGAQTKGFVPHGARARWPFVVGTRGAYRPPAWSAHLFLWWGVLEAVLGLQSAKTNEYWKALPSDYLETFMHAGEVGIGHPSRLFAAQLVGERESVLDVGCGPGANYEVLDSLGRASTYVGVDASERAIEVARARYPRGDFRVVDGAHVTDVLGRESWDVVIVRHLLEHLPDFEPVMSEALEASRRLAVFVFFLTPRDLPLGIRKVNLRYGAPQFLYVYSRSAVDRLLAERGLDFSWHHGVGTSRAGWFAGEVNSVLVVRTSDGSGATERVPEV